MAALTLNCSSMILSNPSAVTARVRSESAVRPIGTERCGTGRAFGKSCRIDLIVLRISERLLPVMMEFQAAAHLSRDPCHRLLRLLKSVEIKIERSVFGDRSKLPTEPTHFRTLWVRSDQTPPTFRPFTERIFLRSDRSDQTDRRFRTHPQCLFDLPGVNMQLNTRGHHTYCLQGNHKST
jgi:hypothetical protein